MSDNTLPIHPTTGLRALGYGKRGPIWPVIGGAADSGHPGAPGDGGNDGDSGTDADGDSGGDQQKPTETVEFWKSKSRDWERQSKANATAAEKLQKLEDAQKSETQKAADAKAAAESELAKIPTKVAEGLRDHLVKLHKISDEDSELFLTASDPELLLKQVNRLVGGSDKSKRNSAPREGRTPQRPSEDPARSAVRELFSN